MRIRDLLQKTELPEQEHGAWAIKKFTIEEQDSSLFNMQSLFAGHLGRDVEPGDFTKLVNTEHNYLMMSDTPAELRDHFAPVMEAKDHCLIAGLGLGIVVEASLRKEDVTKVTVLELETDIIKMVHPYLNKKWGKKLEVIHCDALEWRPPKGQRYGMCWFDIWPSMDSDNLPEMHLLHRRYGSKADWKGSWGREYIERDLRSNRGWW
jgi:hypothetical protein